MKIRDPKTGAVAEVNESYGLRLIEQGRAVAVPEAKSVRKAKPQPAKAEEAEVMADEPEGQGA